MDYRDMSEWMTNLPEALQEIPLNRLAIPGSHDSGSYDLTTEMSPSAPLALRLLASLPGYAKLFGSTVLDIATCQNLTMGKQLEAGVRHLDFRVSSKAGKEDIYFVHSVYGTKVRDAFSAVKNFLDAHPHEVVIIDIQHFHEMDAAQHTSFIGLIKTTFGTKLCPRREMKDLTLKSMWNDKQQLICIYQDDAASQEKDLWTSDAIQSPWPNTTSPEECVSKLTQYMGQAEDVLDKFFVCQGVVTPDTSYILSHCCGVSVHKMTQQLNPLFNTWLAQSPSRWKHEPNIVIHDFIEDAGYVQNVLDLNKNRI